MTASDAAASDNFGYHVSISEDYALVGAYYDDDNGSNSGSAYLFHRNGTSWSEIQKYTAYDGLASDYLGMAVSMDNDVAVIGGSQEDTMASNAGAAYIYPIAHKARISVINEQMITHETSANPIPITILNEPAGNFTLTASSSNQSLVPDSSIDIAA
ncbi:MAG: hypothetical protein OMM_13776, partial [Candidatus Magnetoglobus multicellularis str. Araruama]